MGSVYQDGKQNSTGFQARKKKKTPAAQILADRGVGTSIRALMSAVDELGKAAGADDLFLSFIIAGKVGLFLVVGPADEALQFGDSHVNPPAPR
jgi:hypothetical protein